MATKRILIGSLIIVAFVICVYFTRSWSTSLVIVAGIIVYVLWVIFFELRLGGRKKRVEDMYRSQKEEHDKRTKDNFTLR